MGRATALAYARSAVAGICAADLSSGALNDLLKECSRVATHPKFRAIAVKTDVTKEEEVKGMVEEAVGTFGRIDYAANIAGARCFHSPS